MSKIQIRKEIITASCAGRVIAEWITWDVHTPEGTASFDTHAEAIDWADYYAREASK